MAIKKFKIEASEQAKKLAKKSVKASDGDWDKAVIDFIDTIPNLPEQGKVISKTYKGWPIVIVGLGNGKCLYHSYLQKANAASDIQFIRGLIKRGDAPEKAVENLGFKTYTRGDVEGACGGKKSVKSAAKRSVKCAETNADLERAKQNIVDGYNNDNWEYGEKTVEEYFKDEDLNRVPILYTTLGDENEHDYQLYADLVDPKIIVEIDGETIYEDKFPNIGALADDLEDFEWDNWYSYYLRYVPDEIVFGEEVNGACGGKKSVNAGRDKLKARKDWAVDVASRYSLFNGKTGDIENSNNKAELIRKCRRMSDPAWVEDNMLSGIVYNNDAQTDVDNADNPNYKPKKKSVKSSKRSRSVKAASADGYKFAFYRDGYRVLSKTENNRGKWLAQKDDEEPFEITYEQARGFEPIDPRNRALQMKLGKALKLPIRSSAVKAAKKDDMNKEAHKWYNISLTKDEYAKFRKFLKENGYKYEPSEEGQNTYVKVYLTKADADKVNKFLDSMDDVESACGGKKSKKTVKASAAAKRRAKKSVKASKYYEITDHYNDEVGRADTEDEARELAKKLVRENDVDHYDIFWVDTDPDSTDDTSYIDTVYADKPFSVAGYYDYKFRDLSDSETFYELKDALEYAQELLGKGTPISMECENAGGRVEITPDEYEEFMITEPEYFEDLPKLAEWISDVQVERMDSRQEPWLDNWQYNTDIGMSVTAMNSLDMTAGTDIPKGWNLYGYDLNGEDVDSSYVTFQGDVEKEIRELFENPEIDTIDLYEVIDEHGTSDYFDTFTREDINASTGVKAALGNKNRTDYASNPIYELDKYVKDLAEGVAAAAGITLTYQVSDEAITFIDGDGTAVFIQPISEITPEPDDLENDIQELVSAIQYEDSDNPEYWPTDTTEDDPDYATRAVQMSVDDELEPVMGDGEKSLSAKIFEFLDEEGGYTDYDQKIEDVAEEFNLPREEAESYVWDWANGLNKSGDEGEDVGYGIDSYGGTIDESTVWELFRIADTEILPNTELAKLDPDVSIDEDSWDFYFGGVSNTGMMGVVKFYIHFKLTSDNVDLNEFVIPEARLYPDFKYYTANLDFDIYTENGKVTDVVLESADIYKSDNSYDTYQSDKFKEAFNVEAIENYIEKLAAPAAEEIYNAVSNL